LVNGNAPAGIEVRFGTAVNVTARNNLADVGNRTRDSATLLQSGNVNTAKINWFANAAAGDLHLADPLSGATNAIDRATPLNTVTNDFDGELRQPVNGKVDVGADEFSILEPPQILEFGLESGQARLRFSTAAQSVYAVERTDRLETGWMVVASNFVADGAVREFTEAERSAATATFYRVRME
jgi:hypothetical protein